VSFKRYTRPPYDALQRLGYVPGDPPEYNAPIGDPIPCKARKLTSSEKNASGRTVTTTFYRVWCDPEAGAAVTESGSEKVQLTSTGESFNVRSVVPYPSRKVIEIEMERTA
jgi:hypothetical protein